MSAGIWSGNPPRAQSPRALAACPNLDEFKVGTPAASAALVHGFAAQGKEATMHTYIRHAAIAVMLLGGTGTASAQQYYAADPVDPVIIGRPLQLTPAQRTTIYRTIIPQRRGRAPIVRERIITEPVAPVVQDYAYGYNGYDADYAYVPPPAPRAIVTPPGAYGDYAYAVGARVPATVRLMPLPPAVVAEVPAVRPYGYMQYFDRVLLVDPVTSTIVADVTGY